ncbi:MAG: hypothetical protein IKY71_07455, partial [Bacteroidaceae bacterium]|nr:hypothetical protein [Bacteroidaceae bacterium]
QKEITAYLQNFIFFLGGDNRFFLPLYSTAALNLIFLPVFLFKPFFIILLAPKRTKRAGLRLTIPPPMRCNYAALRMTGRNKHC